MTAAEQSCETTLADGWFRFISINLARLLGGFVLFVGEILFAVIIVSQLLLVFANLALVNLVAKWRAHLLLLMR